MCFVCEWEKVAEDLERMLDDALYKWARAPLSRIYEQINRSQHCTEQQRGAVEKIRRSLRKRRG